MRLANPKGAQAPKLPAIAEEARVDLSVLIERLTRFMDRKEVIRTERHKAENEYAEKFSAYEALLQTSLYRDNTREGDALHGVLRFFNHNINTMRTRELELTEDIAQTKAVIQNLRDIALAKELTPKVSLAPVNR